MKNHRTSIWLNDDLRSRIKKAIIKLNKEGVHTWDLSSFVRHCIDETLKRMGV